MGDTEKEIGDHHRWAFDAYRSAIWRYEQHRVTRERDETRAALAEVLWWSVALIDELKGNRHWERLLDRPREPPHTGTQRDQIRGVRWVRHRVGHQLVDAVVIKEGFIWPMTMPMVSFQYCWCSVDLLPLAHPDHVWRDGESAYFVHLDGRTVAGTIGELTHMFMEAIVTPPPPTAETEHQHENGSSSGNAG